MPTNKKGKQFEKNWKDASKRQEVFCLRLNDSDLSWNLETTKKTGFTPKSKCDFISFYKGKLFPLELKSTKYKSISIQRSEEDNKAMIKAHQIKSLIEMSQFDGVYSGFLLNFRDEDDSNNLIDETTYWISIEDFSNFLYESSKNSINKLDIVNYGGIIVKSRKMRSNFTYDIKDLFKRIIEDKWVSDSGSDGNNNSNNNTNSNTNNNNNSSNVNDDIVF